MNSFLIFSKHLIAISWIILRFYVFPNRNLRGEQTRLRGWCFSCWVNWPNKRCLYSQCCNVIEVSLSLQKENQVGRLSTQHSPATSVSVEPRACTARAALCSSLKHSSSDRGVQQQTKVQESVLQSSFPDKEKNLIPVSAIITCDRETRRVDRDSHAQGSAEEDSFLLGHGKNRRQTTLPHGPSEKNEPKGHLNPSVNKVQSEETSKEATTPKSILLTSQSKELKVSGETKALPVFVSQ